MKHSPYMTLLQKLHLKPYAIIDYHTHEVPIRSLLEMVSTEDYAGAERLLTSAGDAERAKLLDFFCQHDKFGALATRWCRACPESAFAALQQAIALVRSALIALKGKTSSGLSAKARNLLFRQLQQAEPFLQQAVRNDTTQADAYAWLIQIGAHQDKPRSALHEMFSIAIRSHPNHFPCHYSYCTTLSPVWGGNRNELFDFIRRSALNAPEGSLLYMLVPFGYNELVHDLSIDQAASRTANSEAAADVVSALFTWLQCTPEQLGKQIITAHGAFQTDTLNQFALALYITGAHEEARLALRTLKGRIVPAPWQNLASPAKGSRHPGFVYDQICRTLSIDPCTLAATPHNY